MLVAGAAAGCSFDPSVETDSALPFVGCYRGSQAGGIVLRLASPRSDLLTGRLVLGAPPAERFLVLEGEAESPGLARLQGIAAGSGENVPVLVTRDASDAVMIRIAADPPLGPLARCPEEG